MNDTRFIRPVVQVVLVVGLYGGILVAPAQAIQLVELATLLALSAAALVLQRCTALQRGFVG